MKKIIVSTTINEPTEAIQLFDMMPDWQLIVVGDRRTPADYRLDRGIYLSPEDQERYDPGLSAAIGWDSIQRRNFGFLFAWDFGADVIATVDDDNVPLPGWGENLLVNRRVTVLSYGRANDRTADVFDPLSVTSESRLWHRGFPIELIGRRRYVRSRETIVPRVQADLWNGDPDVDAIGRAMHDPHDVLIAGDLPFTSSLPAPFNSQNTFVSIEALPDYFMFPGVGRFDDIWAAYNCQRAGHRVVFGAPSVVQRRNPHDLGSDLRAELHGYGHALAVARGGAITPAMPGTSWHAYQLYRRHFPRRTEE